MRDDSGSRFFPHIGEDEFRVVLADLTGGDRTMLGRQVPARHRIVIHG